MSALSSFNLAMNESDLPQPEIDIPEGQGVVSNLNIKDHDALLDYLKKRLASGHIQRPTRLNRLSRIDRMISTWQKLSPEDSKREQTEDNTGRQQAIPMNLPILSSHLEDTTAFFAEVFSSQSRDFYTVPPAKDAPAAKELANKMNRDTKARKYYKELTLGIRSLVKYNVGGFAVRWEKGGGQGELAKPGNRIESLDMYNYLWDPSILDVAKIPTEAEWAARITIKNRMWLQKKALAGTLERVEYVLKDQRNMDRANYPMKESSYWRNPPSYIGLTIDGADERTSATSSQTMNWEAYGAGLANDEHPPISGFEVVEMHCWLNAKQFGLQDLLTNPSQAAGLDSPEGVYSLWKIIIVDSCQICSATPVMPTGESPAEIPHYLGYMTVDDTREAQRSVMELLRPFQRFSSFLMNIYIAGARKNIWGTKGVDPSMFDTSKLDQGDVATVLHSKTPGRDVRTGITTLDSNTGVDKSMEMLGVVMDLIQKLFPSQALPSQIAGIDRAIKNQVAAVMQGVQRRLHMTCKIIDADILGPLRMQCYKNLAEGDPDGLDGLDEEMVATVLGSGLAQLNREAVASEIKELLYAILQNPAAATVYDVNKLMTYWSQMMDSPSDLGDFVKAAPPVANIPVGPDGKPIPPDVMTASGLNGGPAAQVPAV